MEAVVSQGGREPVQPWHLVCTALISLFGIGGNIVVLIVYLKSKRISRSSPFNIYINALACVDLLVSAFIVPYYILRLDIYTMPGGQVGMFICKFLIGGAPFWLLDVSAYLLVAIALERRRAILRPFSMLEERPIWKTLLVILLLFLLAAFDQTPTWLGEYYTAKNSTFGSFCSYRRNEQQLSLALHLITFALDYLIPLIIIFFCYIQLKKRLSQMAAERTSHSGDGEGRRDGIVNEEVLLRHTKMAKGTISTTILVVAAFFVCITPDEVAYLTFQFIPVFRMNHLLYQVTGLIRFSNSFVNPILYSYRSVYFHKNFKDVFGDITVIKFWGSARGTWLKRRLTSSDGQSSADPLLTRLHDECPDKSRNPLI